MIQRKKCPACGSTQMRALLSLPYTEKLSPLGFGHPVLATALRNIQFTVVQCLGCTCIYQQDVFDDHEAKIAYSQLWAGSTGFLDISSNAHLVEEIIILKKLCHRADPQVLDFGAGGGHWLKHAQAWGCHASACDIDISSLEACRRFGIHTLGLADLRPGSYDFINLSEVVEHLSDPQQILTQLIEALKPGGYLKLSAPGDRRMLNKLASLAKSPENLGEGEMAHKFSAIEPLFHVNLFNARSMKAMAALLGLEPLNISLLVSYSAVVLTDSWKQVNRNLYHPFKRWRSQGTWQYFKKPLQSTS
ncbi:MAG: class I SAM-dependent methyltransferase [Verrucomicrobiaceae bacterium]|nr:class I SAM-dependent methyltransferase [Verrucomicrobiaceae bacterium]